VTMSGCRDVGRSLLRKVEEASCSTGSDNLVAVLSRVRRWREVVKNGVRRLSGGDRGRKNWRIRRQQESACHGGGRADLRPSGRPRRMTDRADDPFPKTRRIARGRFQGERDGREGRRVRRPPGARTLDNKLQVGHHG